MNAAVRVDLWDALRQMARSSGLESDADPLACTRAWIRSKEPRRRSVLAFVPLVDDRVAAHNGDPVWRDVAAVLSYLDRWGRHDPIYGPDVRLVLGNYAPPPGLASSLLPREGGARYLKLASVLAHEVAKSTARSH